MGRSWELLPAGWRMDMPRQRVTQRAFAQVPARQLSDQGAGERVRLDQLPAWSRPRARAWLADVDGDGASELLSLADGSLRVYARDARGGYAGAQAVYVSDGSWLVCDVCVGDVTGDGLPALVMLVWKLGSYGQVRPFWVDDDPPTPSQHVFVLQWRDDEVFTRGLHPVWMSSALGWEVAGMRVDDRGRVELTASDGSWSAWQWDYWGLALAEQGQA